jgi:hypothetical protein
MIFRGKRGGGDGIENQRVAVARRFWVIDCRSADASEIQTRCLQWPALPYAISVSHDD